MPSTQADRSATRDDRIDCAIHYCNARWRTKPRVTVERIIRLTGYKDSTIRRFVNRMPHQFTIGEDDSIRFARDYAPQSHPLFGVMLPAGVRRSKHGATYTESESEEIARRMRVVLARSRKLKGS